MHKTHFVKNLISYDLYGSKPYDLYGSKSYDLNGSKLGESYDLYGSKLGESSLPILFAYKYLKSL